MGTIRYATRVRPCDPDRAALVAPYFVNYHLEHHLMFYVPCYNLPRVHKILSSGPYAARMEVQPGYAAVLRLATAKPADEDRPGELASNVRRARAGFAVDDNQISAGFRAALDPQIVSPRTCPRKPNGFVLTGRGTSMS